VLQNRQLSRIQTSSSNEVFFNLNKNGKNNPITFVEPRKNNYQTYADPSSEGVPHCSVLALKVRRVQISFLCLM
jgi:hypothetical protein